MIKPFPVTSIPEQWEDNMKSSVIPLIIPLNIQSYIKYFSFVAFFNWLMLWILTGSLGFFQDCIDYTKFKDQ